MKRVVSVLSHPQHAGMLRALRILDDAAPARGWTMTHVVPEANGLVASMLPPDRTIVVPGVAGWRRWTQRLALAPAIARLARAARGADALYAVTLSTLPHCLLAGRAAGVPSVVHVYSSYGDARPYRKHWLARARHVVAPSADSLRLAERAIGGFAPGTRARVAYNGMDVARIVGEASGASPLPATSAPTIGMVGNQDARKNPMLVVEAAGIVRRSVPDLRVVLVGAFPDPTYEAAVRARAVALGLADALVVTGFLPNPFPVLRRLDVVVHPALRDPFPLALLEAMALARPIVAAAVGGIPEMLVDGESGVLVPADDAPALAAGVASLIGDRERRERMGAAAHRRLTTVFTLDRFTAEMFAAFADAAAEAA